MNFKMLQCSVGQKYPDRGPNLTTKLCPLKDRSPAQSKRLSNFGSVTTMTKQGICSTHFYRFDLKLTTKWKEDNETNSLKCKIGFIQSLSTMIQHTLFRTQVSTVPCK